MYFTFVLIYAIMTEVPNSMECHRASPTPTSDSVLCILTPSLSRAEAHWLLFSASQFALAITFVAAGIYLTKCVCVVSVVLRVCAHCICGVFLPPSQMNAVPLSERSYAQWKKLTLWMCGGHWRGRARTLTLRLAGACTGSS
jgi:hypothetical protein